MRTLAHIIVPLVLVGMPLQGPQKERFLIPPDIKNEGVRWDPDPLWVSISWDPRFDPPFKKIRDEVSLRLQKPYVPDTSGGWARKLKAAYADWYADHQNTEKLYRVSAYLIVVNTVDEKFAASREWRSMDGDVNKGWSCIRIENTPPSYEFARRGYMTNAGDSDYHRFKDLSIRLLKRDPVDRGVVIAMVQEYNHRKPNAQFEKVMFDSLFACAKTRAWRPWDDRFIAQALRCYGRDHQQKSYYNKALVYMDRCIAKTPPGVDPKPMKVLRSEILKERDLPNFGRPAGKWRYIDDGSPKP